MKCSEFIYNRFACKLTICSSLTLFTALFSIGSQADFESQTVKTGKQDTIVFWSKESSQTLVKSATNKTNKIIRRPITMMTISKGATEFRIDRDGDGITDVERILAGNLRIEKRYPRRGRFQQMQITQDLSANNSGPKSKLLATYQYNEKLQKYRLQAAFRIPLKIYFDESKPSSSSIAIAPGLTGANNHLSCDPNPALGFSRPEMIQLGDHLNTAAVTSSPNFQEQIDGSCDEWKQKIVKSFTHISIKPSDDPPEFVECLNKLSHLREQGLLLDAKFTAKLFLKSLKNDGKIFCTEEIPDGRNAMYLNEDSIRLRPTWLKTADQKSIDKAIFHELLHSEGLGEETVQKAVNCCATGYSPELASCSDLGKETTRTQLGEAVLGPQSVQLSNTATSQAEDARRSEVAAPNQIYQAETIMPMRPDSLEDVRAYAANRATAMDQTVAAAERAVEALNPLPSAHASETEPTRREHNDTGKPHTDTDMPTGSHGSLNSTSTSSATATATATATANPASLGRNYLPTLDVNAGAEGQSSTVATNDFGTTSNSNDGNASIILDRPTKSEHIPKENSVPTTESRPGSRPVSSITRSTADSKKTATASREQIQGADDRSANTVRSLAIRGESFGVGVGAGPAAKDNPPHGATNSAVVTTPVTGSTVSSSANSTNRDRSRGPGQESQKRPEANKKPADLITSRILNEQDLAVLLRSAKNEDRLRLLNSPELTQVLKNLGVQIIDGHHVYGSPARKRRSLKSFLAEEPKR